MARGPVLVGFAGFSICSLLLGCASTPVVTPGLASAPPLGGTGLADERPHDVVANGHESCEAVTGRSPLRGHLPPCPNATHPIVSVSLPPEPIEGAHESLVLPWLEHFYVGWPCPHPAPASETKAIAWSPAPPAPSSCASP
jgi:hypothetical protein